MANINIKIIEMEQADKVIISGKGIGYPQVHLIKKGEEKIIAKIIEDVMARKA